MNMNLQDLIDKGAFVSEALVSRSITWKRIGVDGAETEDTFSVFVKKQSFGTVEAIYGNEEDRARMSKYISESIRLGEKGEQSMTYDQAMQLDPGLGNQLVTAINEVNGLGGAKQKN